MFRFGDSPDGTLKCSFCGKNQDQVGHLVAGPGVYICDECAVLVTEIVAEGRARAQPDSESLTAGPEVFLEALRARHRAPSLQPALEMLAQVLATPNPAHVFLLGPTGSGKTAILHSLALVAGRPVAHGDLSALTEAGYAGDDFGCLLLGLIRAADYDVKRAERGVVILENFDHRDQMMRPRRGIQMEMLRALEGTEVEVAPSSRRSPHQEGILLNTSGILFIATGTFDLTGPVEDPRQALRNWGLTPATVARFPHFVQLPPPGREDLAAVLADDHPRRDEVLDEALRLDLGFWGLRHA